mgnify:CR=1 FL=1
MFILNWLEKVAIDILVKDTLKDILVTLRYHIENYIILEIRPNRPKDDKLLDDQLLDYRPLDINGLRILPMQFAVYKDKDSQVKNIYKFWIYVDMWMRKPLEKEDRYRTEVGHPSLEFKVRILRFEGKDVACLSDKIVCDTATEVAISVKNFINREDKGGDDEIEDTSPTIDPSEYVSDPSMDPSMEPSLVHSGSIKKMKFGQTKKRVYHSKTKGDFTTLSTDIGSDFDIMGKGFYFGSQDYAAQYGYPEIYEVDGKFATMKQWVKILMKFEDKQINRQRQLAREYLKSQGYDGVDAGYTGVVWNVNAIRKEGKIKA